MDKSNRKQFFQDHPWTVRPTAFLILLLSPALFTAYALRESWDDIEEAYSEAWERLKHG